MAWKKWKVGLVIAFIFGLLTAGAGLMGSMNWKSFVAVLCTALLTNLGSYLKTHPLEDIQDDSTAAGTRAQVAKVGLLLCLAVLVLFGMTGCGAFRTPVPTTTFSARLGGQRFEWSNPKNTSLTNVVMEVATNGTARLSIGAVTSVNDPATVSNSYTGEAMVLHEFGTQLNQAVQTGASAAGTFVGKAAGAAVKTP